MSIKTKDEIVTKLRAAGIRPSVHRVAIAEYIARCTNHPTVDDIFVALSRDFPTLSRTTVYNTVWLLADAGVIGAVTIERANTRFDLEDAAHAHFRCRQCGAVVDLEMPEMLQHGAEGLRIDTTNVYYEGLCANCLSMAADKNKD